MQVRKITPETLERRFRDCFTEDDPSECWLWQGKKLPTGYGLINITRGKQTYAHRLAYQLNHGPIPEGLFVCHTCDVPSCVNPAHLWVGTPKENTHDMIRKGRKVNAPLRGEESPVALLTDDQVRQIRLRRANGESTHSLASAFGVNHRTISVAANGTHWTHIKDVAPLPSRSVLSSNRFFELNGDRATLKEWADRLGMHSSGILYRIAAGWPLEKALLTPRLIRAA